MSLYDGIKDVVSIVQKADNIELYQKVLDLQKEALDMIEENRLLKEKIRQLEDNKVVKENLVFNNNNYYLKKDNGELDGPFCSTCWDKNNKLIRMTISTVYSSKKYKCNACGFWTEIK